MAKRICSIPDCDKVHQAKGFCRMHYKRLLRNGDPLKRVRVKGGLGCKVIGCEKRNYTGGYCSGHYVRWKNHGDPLAGMAFRGERQRFLTEVLPSLDTDNCILWPYSNVHGYGKLEIDGKPVGAHRASLIQASGPPPTPKHQACHKPIICHNPLCVNPKHLYWGTPSDNCKDKYLDGTLSRGETVSKLSERDVLEIRNSKISQTVLAKKYEVSPSQIGRIRRREQWAWLSDDEIRAKLEEAYDG